MACNSKNSLNKDVQNDSEVEETLLKNCETLPDLKERPLSPVLSSSTVNRKILMGHRSRRNKSRVKLTDRFAENDRQKTNSTVSNTDVCIQEFLEDGFLSQAESLIKRIEKLEDIETYRKNVYKIVVKDGRNGDFRFKKPISPAPNKSKKAKSNHAGGNYMDTVESEVEGESEVENVTKFSDGRQIDLPKCSGFQTATGKTIEVSDTDIERHSKLFEDIINPSQNCDTDRNKKYAFLTKSKSKIYIKQNNFDAIKPVLSESILNATKLTNNALNSVQTKLVGDFQHCNKSTRSNVGARKYTNPLCAKAGQLSTNKDNSNIQSEVSLTQEICESGISNTQMLCAMDDALSAVGCNDEIIPSKCDDGFKGFNSKEAAESHDLFVQLSNIYQGIEQINRNHNAKSIFSNNSTLDKAFKREEVRANLKKHIMDLPLPPEKRHCGTFGYVSHGSNRIPTAQSKGTGTEAAKEAHCGEFSSVFKKSINISESATTEARTVLDDIDLNFCQNDKLLEKNPVGDGTYKNISLGGFSSASGKPIKISNHFLRKARNIFDNIEIDAFKENINKVGSSRSATELTSNSNQMLFRETGKMEEAKVAEKTVNYANHSSSASQTFMNPDDSPVRMIRRSFDYVNRKSSDTDKLPVDSDFPSTPGFQLAGRDKLQLSDEAQRRAQKNLDTKFKDTRGEMVTPGFQTASGNKLKISKVALRKAQKMFKDIEKEADTVMPEFQKAGGDKLKISEEVLSGAQKNLNDIGLERKGAGELTPDFRTASGSNLKISEKTPRKAQNFFNGELEEKRANIVAASKNKLKIFDETLRRAQKDNSDIELGEKRAEAVTPGFQTAGGSKLKISEAALRQAQNIFNDIELEEKRGDLVTPGFKKVAGESKLKTFDENLKRAQKNISDIELKRKGAEVVTPIKTSGLRGSAVADLSTKPKRRLGISSCKLIQIPESKLNKAKLLFEEEFCSKSPIRPRPSTTYTSTPVKQNFCSTPVKNDLLRSSNNFSSFIDSAVITPIKSNVTEDKKIDFVPVPNSEIMFASPAKGSIFDRLNELEAERKELKERLKTVVERQKTLESLKEEKLDKRPRKGILYQSKCTKPKVSLSSLVFDEIPEGVHADNDFYHVTPQNAGKVHFKQFCDSVTTKDGAVIVPNSKDIIGVSEIENAFNAMPGVEPRLIPNGWLKNHYKWIIWKLASYERMFPIQLNGCFCIENVIQQLKYRYDREIDRAERSALRRIFEKDDAPQKRIVLCVSGIRKIIANTYELELTDGWYGIRTVLDEPLCNQILNGKIKIGTKLVICGAELLNCDGCYPLESNDLACLRIHFNSTRRASWHAKLGYQRNPGPFPIQICSIHPLGGRIGAVRIFVVRVYPFNYFERLEGQSVWRNKKAEEMRAQQWENERREKLEEILENVTKDFDHSQASQNSNLANEYSNISDISCPRTLYEIMKASKDPDRFQQKLSAWQRNAILEYQNTRYIRKQEELTSKMKENAEKLSLAKRNVVAILKLLVIDVSSSDKAFNFYMWGPTESHTQTLTEGSCFTVQNVTARKNGDLNSNIKTMFTPESSNQDFCDRFKRKLVQIVDLGQANFSPDFNEIDTVGVVVQTKVDDRNQEIWLTDNSGRLLLVKIYEGPKTCLMLDHLKRGQATTVCNLRYCSLRDEIVQTLANHFTVVSSYSQHRHLQEGLEILKKTLPKDVETLLRDCDSRIEAFRIENSNFKNSCHTNFEDSDEDTLVSSRITSTDVALSLIDLDKFM